MTNYVATLVALVPGALISYTGVDVPYEAIEWLDERAKPTKPECDAAWPQVNYQLEYEKIELLRRARYQAETDGMFFAAQRTDGNLQAWMDAVDRIKADLPYPPEPKK